MTLAVGEPPKRRKRDKPKRGNGEGEIAKNAAGRWVARISIQGERRKFTASSKAEALERMNAWRSTRGHVKRGEHLETVADVLNAWLAHLRTSGVRESTTERCYGPKVRLHLIPRVGEMKIRHLDPDKVLGAIRTARRFEHSGRAGETATETRRPLSPRSIQMLWVVLKAALNWAVKKKKIGSNPLTGQEAPRVESEPGAGIEAWGPEQASALLASSRAAIDVAPHPDIRRSLAVQHVLWTVLLTSGLRISEALGLEWGDLDAPAGVLHVRAQLVRSKNGDPQRGPLKGKYSRRSIPLASQALTALETLRGDGPGWIFKTSKGTPYAPRNINRLWDQAIETAGLPRIKLHGTRHTTISLLLASGGNKYAVAAHAGHAVAVMDSAYAHVLPKQAQACAEIMTRLLHVSPTPAGATRATTPPTLTSAPAPMRTLS